MAGEIAKTLARCVARRAQCEREREDAEQERDAALKRVKALEFELALEKLTRAELEAQLRPVRLVDGETGKFIGG